MSDVMSIIMWILIISFRYFHSVEYLMSLSENPLEKRASSDFTKTLRRTLLAKYLE